MVSVNCEVDVKKEMEDHQNLMREYLEMDGPPEAMAYTGPPCMCGDPTPGTPEEKEHAHKVFVWDYGTSMMNTTDLIRHEIDKMILQDLLNATGM